METLVIVTPSFWRGKRVLVTGHTGFKGSWLTFWLLNMGAEVWGYSLAAEPSKSLLDDLQRDHPGALNSYVNLHQQHADLCDLAALQSFVAQAQPQVALHLAAQSLVRRSYTNPLGTWATNVQGSLNLLEALKPLQHPCRW